MIFDIGKLSKNFQVGLKELAVDYGFALAGGGLKVTAAPGDSLGIKKSDTVLSIEYSKPCEFYRAFIAALNKPAGFTRTEKSTFERLGIMADNAAGAVFNMPTAKKLVRMLSVCGYDYFQLYSEDTYELPGEPYFGYLRGRRTASEIRELDAYAEIFGIELMPCIQTLAHMKPIARWQPYFGIIDHDDTLLADEEKTYELIDKMFKFAADNFRSRRINIGMDEAHMLGRGVFFDKHGYQNQCDVFRRHLDRVLSIADKYGFKCSMWCDMFFRLVFKDYEAVGFNLSEGFYKEKAKALSGEVAKLIPKNVELIYWDYFPENKKCYDEMIKVLKLAPNDITFAGGFGTWKGFLPLSAASLKVTEPALESCAENGIKNVLMTLWGLTECSVFAILPAIVYAAEKAYGNAGYKEAFEDISGCDFDGFTALDSANGADVEKGYWSNYAKIFLFNDCLTGIYDALVTPHFKERYKKARKILKAQKERGGRFAYLFECACALNEVLELKHDIGVLLREAYSKGDKAALRLLAGKMSKIAVKTETFYGFFRKRWLQENKPFGLETYDARLGGLSNRIRLCAGTVLDYCEGRLDKIAELEQEILPVFCDYPGVIEISSWEQLHVPFYRGDR